MPQYKCTNCGQTFWDDADLEGDACNRCDDGYVEIIGWAHDDCYNLDEVFLDDWDIKTNEH